MADRELREIEAGETALAFPALQALRPQVADEEELVRVVDQVQRPDGYRLVGAFEPGEELAVAVAGYRVSHNLAWGHHLYVDDLTTVPAARRRGHARALLDWLHDEAARLGCQQVHLDSGVGIERAAAHRLYLEAGFVISSHHFARPVGGGGR